ncbi:MAG TPA: hypothetical protein PL045_11830 [Chitinophagaceae bacterium]|nr:hypothetical protein [Chitinophagaceae bacterium]
MKNSITEIIEEARKRIYEQDEAQLQSENEKNHEYDLGYAGRCIRSWKKNYFRKNSKHPAKIYVRIRSLLLDGNYYYQHFLQLFVNAKLQEECRIRPEASDSLTIGLSSEVFQGIEIFVLYQFTPQQKINHAKNPR